MQQLIFDNVRYTKVLPNGTTAIAFNPTKLVVYMGARLIGKGAPDANGNPTDVIEIEIELTETLSNGYNKQYKNLVIPTAYLDNAINGFDPVKMEPTYNMAVLGQVLAGFDLAIV